MKWLYNLNKLQYEQLLTILFTHCDTITCVGTKEQCAIFNEVIYECIGKCPLRQSRSYSSDQMESIFEYTFMCSEKTRQFFKQQQFYRLNWQMIHVESLTFWKEEHCIFHVMSNRFVELEMDSALEKQIVHLFEKVKENG